jgi:multidrug efflux pump subunit AcrA (membrane-fusion protein)
LCRAQEAEAATAAAEEAQAALAAEQGRAFKLEAQVAELRQALSRSADLERELEVSVRGLSPSDSPTLVVSGNVLLRRPGARAGGAHRECDLACSWQCWWTPHHDYMLIDSCRALQRARNALQQMEASTKKGGGIFSYITGAS